MCTNIYFNSRNNHWFFGRTQEYAADTPVCGITVEARSTIPFSNLSYQSRVTCGGVNFDGSSWNQELIMLLDGLNEAGLVGATLDFKNIFANIKVKKKLKHQTDWYFAQKKVLLGF